jgi:ABC transporter transmembrane region
MGRKIGDLLQNFFQFTLSFAAALYLCWQLTVVLLASFPVIAASGTFRSYMHFFCFFPRLIPRPGTFSFQSITTSTEEDKRN